MALSADDPWYMAPPTDRLDPLMLRYKRAVALSRMRHEIQVMRRSKLDRTTQIAYREYCIEHWQAYLDGDVEPPTGRKMKENS